MVEGEREIAKDLCSIPARRCGPRLVSLASSTTSFSKCSGVRLGMGFLGPRFNRQADRFSPELKKRFLIV